MTAHTRFSIILQVMEESMKGNGDTEGMQFGILQGKEFPLETDEDVVKAIKETVEALGGKVQ